MNFKEQFRHVAHDVVLALSSHWSFIVFFVVIFGWLIIGYFVHFTETWQLTLHISLAIITFLMVLLIQHIQHRETQSMHLKLDELLRGVEGSSNAYVHIQAEPSHVLDKLQADSKAAHYDSSVDLNIESEGS
ncbi:MAG: low affinity iron permease family protein [Bdellovibrio sp.]|nr:low affinity iron permease family protein [Methylotenera sp.]